MFLYKQLPSHIHEAFEKKYGLTMKTVIENVYNRPHANVYLASFVRFISDYKNEEPFQTILKEGMKEFMTTHVCCFPEHKEVPVHFIGSVAYYYQEAIQSAAGELGITLGQIIRKPIDNIVKYHTEHLIKTVN